jgi:hypothetical protein
LGGNASFVAAVNKSFDAPLAAIALTQLTPGHWSREASSDDRGCACWKSIINPILPPS